MATYASTGGAGVDVEVDYATLLAICLIGEHGDRTLPTGAVPRKLSLQRRDGPSWFDDIVVDWRLGEGDGVTFIQSKRAFSLGDNADFRPLARALAEFQDDRNWSAAIVVGSLKPNAGDIQELLESARLSTSAAEFGEKWKALGTLNPAKRQVLRGFAKATEGLGENAAWDAMRRLRVIEHDLPLPSSIDRQRAFDLLGQLLVDSSMVQAAMAMLRSSLLATAQLAPIFDRSTLLERAPELAILPVRRLRPIFDHILAESQTAIGTVGDHLQDADHAVTLLRPESWTSLKEAAAKGQTVRVTGDAGCGKSTLLKRHSATFEGSVLVLSEKRIVARSWSDLANSWGTPISADDVISGLGSSSPCLLAIDGADRMLLDHRRNIILDLFNAIAASPMRARWSIVTSGRDFAQRDLVRDALREAGLGVGERMMLGALEDGDANTLVSVFPAAGSLLSRSDLAGLNRNPFMLQQLLKSNDLPAIITEIGLADAWATRGARTAPLATARDTVVAQLAAARIADPAVVPSVAALDPDGVEKLIEEGSIARLPLRDGLVFTHDVLEDWALARELQRDWRSIPDRLRSAEQPLWWQRAVRLVGQMLLEAGCDAEWQELLALLEQDDLDPAWGRLVLVAPLHSESAASLLPRLQPVLLGNEARLLGQLLESMQVIETRIQEGLLDSPLFADMSEAERFRPAAQFKTPVMRTWVAFMSWALPQWQEWPDRLLPSLVEVSEIWTKNWERRANWISDHIATHIVVWLQKVEDYEHPEEIRFGRGERVEPFALGLRHRLWKELEERLRRVLTMTVASAPETFVNYLNRVTSERRLRSARNWLLMNPRQVPSNLPRPWTLMMQTQLLRRRRQHRDGLLGPSSCFDFPASFNEAGIDDPSAFYPSSPLQGGWEQLFQRDPDGALATMHRLEMRAAVYWRNRSKRREGRRPRPLVLNLPMGPVQLWGDETVYRWSRAILGPNALGSAYLALDNWLHAQLSEGGDLADLVQRVIQNNGLVSTVSPLIQAAAERQNDMAALSAIAPLLAAPRLWGYDIRRHIDDQSPTHRMSLVGGRHRHHVEAVEEVWVRYRQRGPLHHQLLLPFHLLADQEAQALLQDRRVRWKLEDLADFDDELDDDAWCAEHEKTLARFISDADRNSVRFEEGPEPNQIAVHIDPPEDLVTETEFATREHNRAGALSSLAVWAERSLQDGSVSPEYSLSAALDALASLEQPQDIEDQSMMGRFSRAASAGVAAVLARFGEKTTIEEQAEWLRDRLQTAATRQRMPQENAFLNPETMLSMDPQMLAAGGLAALTSRRLMPEFEQLVAELVTLDLHAVSAATLRGLDWEARPDFAWRCAAAALDMCVYNFMSEWLKPRQRAKAEWSNLSRRLIAIGHITGSDKTRLPQLPPSPFRERWVLSGRFWPPITRVRIRATCGLHWGQVKTVLDALPFDRIDEKGRHLLRDYLLGLARWARMHSDPEQLEPGYQDEFPHDLADTLAHAIGRLSAVSGDKVSWHCLTFLDRSYRDDELIGIYIDEIVRELVDSQRIPDARFWSAWQPASDWIMAKPVPKHSGDDWDSLGQPIRAAGFVGPYMTPLPPNWPHLEYLLPTIDAWVKKTASHPAAATAMLAIGERMSADQREQWLLPWLEHYGALHGRDTGFWTFGGLADGAAGLLPPLDNRPEPIRKRVRQLLSVIADTGSLSARELLPRFASGRSA